MDARFLTACCCTNGGYTWFGWHLYLRLTWDSTNLNRDTQKYAVRDLAHLNGGDSRPSTIRTFK